MPDLGTQAGAFIPIPPAAAPPVSQVVRPPAPVAAPTPAAPSAAPAAPQAVTDILAQHDPSFDAFYGHMVAGESGGHDVPNYRYGPGYTASGQSQITDTNWKTFAPKLGIDVQRYPTAMSAPGDYQKAVTKLMFKWQGQEPWDAAHGGSLPVGGGSMGMSPESSALYAKANKDMQGAADDLKKRLAGVDPASPDFMKQVRAATDRVNEASDAMMRSIAEKPQPPTPDIGKLGNVATIIGIIGGLLTREPMIGALNGAAAAIGASNEGDWARYKAGMDTWKTQSDMLLHIAELQQRHLQDIMQDNSREMNDRLAMANSFLRANQMVPQLEMLEAGQIDKAIEMGVQMQTNIEKLRQANAQLPLIEAKTDEAREKGLLERQQREMEFGGGGPPSSAAPTSGASVSGDPHSSPPPPQGVDPAVWTAANTYVMTGKSPPLGFGGSALKAAINRQVPNVLQARGMSLDDMYQGWAKYGALTAGERYLGTRAAPLAVGIGEAQQAAPAVIQTSEAVPRSSLGPAFNAFLEGVQLHSGDPRIVQFSAALNTFLNIYSKAINPTGRMTDQQQRHAYETLNTAMSKGQIQGGVDQLLQELQYAKQGLGDAVNTVGNLLNPGQGGGSQTFSSAEDVRRAYQGGTISRDDAAKILREKGWAQ